MQVLTSSYFRYFLPWLALSSAATTISAQVPTCPAGEDFRVRETFIVGSKDGSPNLTRPSSLDIPSEGRFADGIFVRVIPDAPSTRGNDSIYISATFELILNSPSGPHTSSGLMTFPARTVKDTIVAFQPGIPVDVGPFSTNRLVPWPGKAVQATANALPTRVRALAWILRVRKESGGSCVEPLRNNMARSLPVTLEFAH
jgi:hypothetical protein